MIKALTIMKYFYSYSIYFNQQSKVRSCNVCMYFYKGVTVTRLDSKSISFLTKICFLTN